jgi:hypothetical protein
MESNYTFRKNKIQRRPEEEKRKETGSVRFPLMPYL